MGGEVEAACGHLLHTLGRDDRSVLMPLIRAKLRQGTPWWLRQQQAAPFIKLMGFIFLTLAIYQRWRRRDGGRKRDQIPRRLQQLGEEGVGGGGGWEGNLIHVPSPSSHHSLGCPVVSHHSPLRRRASSCRTPQKETLTFSIRPPPFQARSLQLPAPPCNSLPLLFTHLFFILLLFPPPKRSLSSPPSPPPCTAGLWR